MTVTFQKLRTNIRTPLFHQEQDNSAAQSFQPNYSAVIVAAVLPNGTAVGGEIETVTSLGQAQLLGGRGSMYEKMADYYLSNNQTVQLKILAVDEPGAGSPAALPVTVVGPATADGVLELYIGDDLLRVPVTATDTPTIIGDAIVALLGVDEAAAVAANSSYQVIAANVAGVVTFTSRQIGEEYNDILITANSDDQIYPAGISLTGTGRLVGGAGNPDITAALASLEAEPFDFFASGFTDTNNINAVRDMFDDTTGRWSDGQQLYGHSWTARNQNLNDLIVFGETRNDQHQTNVGLYNSDTPSFRIAADFMAAAAASLSINPAVPLQTSVLSKVRPPKKADRFSQPEREILLNSGIATTTVNGGNQVAIERSITSYRVDSFNNPDASYLDVQTLAINQFRMKDMKALIEGKYAKKILVDSGSLGASNTDTVTPAAIRGALIARYQTLEEETSMVENSAQYAKDIIVERDENDQNRVNILDTPINAGQLRVVALRNQFRTSAQVGSAA